MFTQRLTRRKTSFLAVNDQLFETASRSIRIEFLPRQRVAANSNVTVSAVQCSFALS